MTRPFVALAVLFGVFFVWRSVNADPKPGGDEKPVPTGGLLERMSALEETVTSQATQIAQLKQDNATLAKKIENLAQAVEVVQNRAHVLKNGDYELRLHGKGELAVINTKTDNGNWVKMDGPVK